MKLLQIDKWYSDNQWSQAQNHHPGHQWKKIKNKRNAANDIALYRKCGVAVFCFQYLTAEQYKVAKLNQMTNIFTIYYSISAMAGARALAPAPTTPTMSTNWRFSWILFETVCPTIIVSLRNQIVYRSWWIVCVCTVYAAVFHFWTKWNHRRLKIVKSKNKLNSICVYLRLADWISMDSRRVFQSYSKSTS